MKHLRSLTGGVLALSLSVASAEDIQFSDKVDGEIGDYSIISLKNPAQACLSVVTPYQSNIFCFETSNTQAPLEIRLGESFRKEAVEYERIHILAGDKNFLNCLAITPSTAQMGIGLSCSK